MKKSRLPPMQYDGRMWWYTEWFDQEDDRCCICRELIPEEDVPLILFKTVGGQTWQARLHWDPCAQPFMARAKVHSPETMNDE